MYKRTPHLALIILTMIMNGRIQNSSPEKLRRVLDIRYFSQSVIFIFLLFIFFIIGLSNTVLAATFAEREINAFTKSRQGTEKIMHEGQEVYQFLKNAFAGLYTSVPLAWDPAEPNDYAYAEHKPSVDRKFIKLRVSSTLSPLDQVACLVYEAINAQNEKEFTDITEKAHKGVLTKIEFIHSILRLEHKSLKKTYSLLSKQEPYNNIELSRTIFYRKMSGTPEKFDAFLEYLQRIKRVEYDVYKHYSDFYDFVIPPAKRLKAKQERMAAGSKNKTSKEEGKTP